MIKFNLIEQPWIPCQDNSGNLKDLSIEDLLVNSHLLVAIREESPLVVASLYRLILAIIQRSIDGPKNDKEWAALYKSSGFPDDIKKKIHIYLEKWKSRFDIFDETHPFYQVGDLDQSKFMAITKIAPQLSSGNNPTLFDHTYDEMPPKITYAQAIRWLIAYNAFSLGGLITPYTSPRLTITDKTSKSAPLAKAALILIQGKTLYHTLLLNLIKYDSQKGEPFDIQNEDLPAWEQDTYTEPKERVPNGYIDWLTWQARSMKLIMDPDNTLKKVSVMTGYSLPDSVHRKNYETMIPFKQSPTENTDPFLAIGFSKKRAIWRDFTALSRSISSETGGSTTFPPRNLLWIADLYNKGILDQKDFPILLYGAGSDKASFEFWRTEAYPFDLDFLLKDEYYEIIKQLVGSVERGGDALRSANNILIKEWVSDIRQKLKTKPKLEKKDNDRVKTQIGRAHV